MLPSSLYRFVVLLCIVAVDSSQKACDRLRSRLVRKVVYEKLMPAFSAMSADLSYECPFSPARDVYRTQETHKSLEESSRWYCHFCGKAFFNEYFLDLHFDNRHTDQLEDDNSVCLADTCEVFRCDVIGRSVTPDFWDYALCLEDDMKTLRHKCDLMVKSCVPSGLTENDTRILTEETTETLCSYLTCSKYWEIPFDAGETDSITGIYVILTVFTIFGVIVYYCIFYTYFFTDAFSDSITYDPTPRTKHRISPYQPDLRHRPRSFPAPARASAHPD